MSNYDYFALYYDVLTQNVNYEEQCDYLCAIMDSFKCTGKILVDLGCGTGSLSELMHQKGFDVIGIDNSEQMLACAMEKKYDSGSDIMYLNQNMSELDLFGTVDVIICTLDSLNHLIKKDDVKKTFEKASLFLNKGGLFIFDVNTVYKHENILADNNFIYDCDEVYCVWQNSKCDDNITKIELDLFVNSEEEGVYERFYETFFERAYTHDEIMEFASDAKLELLAVYDENSFDELKENSQRAVYVLKNNEERLPPQNDLV